MGRKSQEQLKLEKIQAAMLPLVAYPEFEAFMETVAALKDDAVEYSVSYDGVAAERQALAVKGEIRAYLNLLNIYENQKAQLEHMAAQQAAERQEEIAPHD